MARQSKSSAKPQGNLFSKPSAEQVSLPPHVARFIEALQDEIVAARKKSSASAVSLRDGKIVQRLGSHKVYLFRIDNELFLPADSPADLILRGYEPMPVSVVSVDGLSITLAVSQDLPSFIPEARLQTDLSQLLKRLIQRLEETGSQDNSLRDAMLAAAPAKGEPLQVRVEGLNEGQLTAVQHALGCNVVFIGGPPGTGKSQVIGAIGYELLRQSKRSLIVSHTNGAVDQALLRILKRGVQVSDLEDGRVLRVGTPKDPEVARDARVSVQYHVEKRSKELAERKQLLTTEVEEKAARLREVQNLVELAAFVAEAAGQIQSCADERIVCMRQDELLRELGDAVQRYEGNARKRSTLKSNAERLQALESELTGCAQQLKACNRTLQEAIQASAGAAKHLAVAESVLTETTQVGWMRRKLRGLIDPEQAQQDVENAKKEWTEQFREEAKHRDIVVRLESEEDSRQDEKRQLSVRVGGDPRHVLRALDQEEEDGEAKRAEAELLVRQVIKARAALRARLFNLAKTFRAVGFPVPNAQEETDLIKGLDSGVERIKVKLEGCSLPELQLEDSALQIRMKAITTELSGIEERLSQIEPEVLRGATVVAATLTGAYLKDSITRTRFDTVVLDEASMAPIPALWYASGLADRSVVVVGDPEQLPPIVLADTAAAKDCMVPDIFDNRPKRQLPESWRPDRLGADGIRWLHVQYRMHPQIAAVANSLSYEGKLKNDPVTTDTNRLGQWCARSTLLDWPVLLVNTNSLSAWVTTVNRTGAPSRLNFLSAALWVELACQSLLADRAGHVAGEPARILLISPYRPQAELFGKMLRDEGIEGEVNAGTTHRFQGAEADVVILDLVNDEPHWKVGMFMQKNSEQFQRLFNVAITRARCRLIIVGDLDYVASQGKKAFVGLRFLPLLRKLAREIDARSVAPQAIARLSARAAAALASKRVGEEVARVVVTQADFYAHLIEDLRLAENRVVIYSPFMTSERCAMMEPHFRAALGRGVSIYVVSKDPSERGKHEARNYQRIEDQLRTWGIQVIHKYRMHEKLVFIDRDVLWSGSLNPLSFSNTQEVMERRKSMAVVEDYAKAMGLDEIIEDFSRSPPLCPVCQSGMALRDGKSGPYWECMARDCKFTRNPGDEPIVDGEIRCASCQGSVEFGEWAGKWVWRCTQNARHRKRFGRAHLKLPKMRAKLTKAQSQLVEG